MAAAALTPTKSTRNTAGAGVASTPAAADATEGNSFVNTGREILVVQTDATPRTIQFFDKNGVSYKTVTLAASKLYVFGPFDRYWHGATTTVKASNTAVTLAVVKLDELKGSQTNTGS